MRVLVHDIGCLARPVMSANGRWRIEETRGRLAIEITDGVISWVGNESDYSSTADELIFTAGQLVTPGLIDAHTHPIFGGNRAGEFEMRTRGATYEEIASAGGGIRSSLAATRALSQDAMENALRRHCEWFHASGTTTIEAKTGYGLTLESEMNALRAMKTVADSDSMTISTTLLAAHTVPPEFVGRIDAYLDFIVNSLMPAAVTEGLVRWVDLFVEQGYFEPDHARRLAQAARAFGLGIRLHVDQLNEGGGAALAVEVGAKTADHLEQTCASGIAELAKSKTMPVLLPASVYALGKSRYPDARAMLDAGLPVVLATDFNPGSSPTPSLPFVLSLACTQLKMTPEEALLGATIHAATSLNMESRKGCVDLGWDGDLTIWDAGSYKEIPYWIGAPLVSTTIVGGGIVYSKN